jgi:hypothetical protein
MRASAALKVGEELGDLPCQGVKVEVPVPELDPVSAANRICWARPSTLARPRVCAATTSVIDETLARARVSRWGQRSSTARAMGGDPANAFHMSGNAQRAWDTTRRRHRLASVIVLPRRCCTPQSKLDRRGDAGRAQLEELARP